MTQQTERPAETTKRTRPAGAGRKRDEAVHERILQAGREVFVTNGWRGFTLDVVGRAAKVGKSSMYLRYSTRDDLILAVVRHYEFPIDEVVGRVHASSLDELRDFAVSYAEWLDTPAGLLSIRLLVELRLNPELAEVLTTHSNEVIDKAHSIVRRAKRRGEIPSSASTAVILDSLLGGLVHHAVTASTQPAYASPTGKAFVGHLVNQVIAGTRTG